MIFVMVHTVNTITRSGVPLMKPNNILLYVSLFFVSQAQASNPVVQKNVAHATQISLESKECVVAIESLWRELNNPAQSNQLADEKLVVIGKITFKNKTDESIKLNTMHLTWHGSPINYMLGSLYKADPDNTFLPIDAYLVCDSTWNKTDQKLMLTFAKSESLSSATTFYMVLTIPKNLEPKLKNGYFQIATHNLPSEFRTYAHQPPARLALR